MNDRKRNKTQIFIFLKAEDNNVGKFRNGEKLEVQSIVADLTIKGIPDRLILQHIFNKTGQRISDRSLRNIRQRIKQESAKWYSQLREGQYEYIYEFKQRINEIRDLQRMHHEIIIRNDNDNVYNPSIIQNSLDELHKLNITLSNYYDIAPYIVSNLGANTNNGHSISTTQQDKKDTDIIV